MKTEILSKQPGSPLFTADENQNKTSMHSNRSQGLDTLRAIAILLVFAYHYEVFVSGTNTFGWASDFGWVGVDLFFVLSGYLISNQVLAGLNSGQELSLRSFYARRAFRTWPVYWVVLALYFAFPSYMEGSQQSELWRFITFTQNFQLQPDTAFSHAWSLCIEEQFYLVLPLVIVLASKVGTGIRQAWLLMFALVMVGITSRAVLWFQYGTEGVGNINGYYTNIYYATLGRFDEFIPGVAIAFIKHFHPAVWQQTMRRGRLLFFIAIVAVSLALYGAHSHYYTSEYGFYPTMTILGYTLIAMSFAVAVMAALSPSSPLCRLRVPGAYHLAIWSYSIYLSHKAVAHILSNFLKSAGVTTSVTLALISVACVLVGAVFYALVERPFFALRDSSFPSLFAGPRGEVDPPPILQTPPS